MLGMNTNTGVEITDFEVINDDSVIVTYSNGMTLNLGIYHWNTSCNTILCDDFETYIKY